MSQPWARALVDGHVISAATLEEALRRQVVYGGSLDTNLLELGVSEAAVLQGLGEAYRMPIGDRGDIDQVPAHIPRIFPLVFAETYRLVPFRLVGNNLGVLTNGEADPELFTRIAERLQLHPAPTVTTEARLHYAMHRLYGVELLPRYKALLTLLDGKAPEPLHGALGTEQVLSWGISSSRIKPSRARGETRRGPPDVAGLLARLDSATDRDSIIEVLLEITLGTFEYVALFLVQGERINGWRSTDPAATQRVARISIPVELPSVFQTIYATRGHYLGPLPHNRTNMQLLEELGRQPPKAALLAPVMVGGKLAGILYGDNGGRGVPSKRVSGILLLTHRVGLCFENLIRKRKQDPVERPRAQAQAALPTTSGVTLPPSAPPPATATAPAAIPATTPAATPEPHVPDELHDSIPTSDEIELVSEPELPQAATAPVDQGGPPPMAHADEEDRWGEEDDWSSVQVEDLPGGRFVQDASPEAASADFMRGLVSVTSNIEIEVDAGAQAEEGHYVAFADVDESPDESVNEWEDVLVDTLGAAPTAGAAPAAPVVVKKSVPPAVDWADVIAEARAAPELVPPRSSVEVAGTVVDERELLLDSLDALDAGARDNAVARLLELGGVSDEVLRERFPGRLTLDPFSTDAPLPAFHECSGLLALVAARGAGAAAIVLPHLESADRARRFFAIYYLLAVHYPQGLEALARRLYDTEPRNRYLAADALRGYTQQPAYGRVLQSLRDQLKVPVYEVQVTTVQVLGQLRDPRAVPSLIPLVVSPQAELANATASALAVICAQAFGRDVARWAEWWQQSYNRPREAWLVASLRHPSPAVQSIAFSELQLMTGYTGTFDPEAPAEAREPIVLVWENWLAQITQARAQDAAGRASH